MEKVDLADKFSQIAEHWRPKVAAELNGQEVKLVKVKGTFPWHTHDREDEMFLVFRGRFRIELRDKIIALEAGQFFVVPHGVEHRTAADEEAEVLIFEPAEVRNTGDIADPVFTAPNGVKI
jgi:quercetin dioxygenase-like cupin family protein